MLLEICELQRGGIESSRNNIISSVSCSFLSIFQPIHLFSINQPITTFHSTGLNVPVLKRLISIIQPCPQYKVKCPCVGHTHTTPTYHPTKLSLLTQFSMEFSLLHLGNNTPIRSYNFSFALSQQRSKEVPCSVSSGARVH